LDFLVREVASFKLWSQAIQAMLQQALNIQCNLRTVVESVWFDDIKAGNYDLAVGAIVSTLLDRRTISTPVQEGRPAELRVLENAPFNALLPQIDARSTRPSARP